MELECRKSDEGRACGDNCGCEVQVGSEVKRDLTADEALAPPRVICLLARRASESGSRSVATRKGAPRCLGGAAVCIPSLSLSQLSGATCGRQGSGESKGGGMEALLVWSWPDGMIGQWLRWSQNVAIEKPGETNKPIPAFCSGCACIAFGVLLCSGRLISLCSAAVKSPASR